MVYKLLMGHVGKVSQLPCTCLQRLVLPANLSRMYWCAAEPSAMDSLP